MLQVSWDGLWTISFGPSQFYGHTCWLVCEVARVLMTVTLQALSLVEKVELVQVRFTLHLRDQMSKWIQYGCRVQVYTDSYMASNCLGFTLHLRARDHTTWFWKCLLGSHNFMVSALGLRVEWPLVENLTLSKQVREKPLKLLLWIIHVLFFSINGYWCKPNNGTTLIT